MINKSDIDYGTIWAEKIRSHNDCTKTNLGNNETEEEYARKYWHYTQLHPERYRPVLDLIDIRPGDTVADIGGGPGTIAIPFASKGASVTIIEPSVSMIKVLKENISNKNLPPISIIQKRWEDVSVFDLKKAYTHIIACLSLNIADIKAAIKKMCSFCSGRIYLVWFSKITPWDEIILNLSQILNKKTYHPYPDGDLLIKILNQMNITPSVTYSTYLFQDEYRDNEALISEYSNLLNASTKEEKSLIKSYMKEKITPKDDKIILKGLVDQMIIYWDINNIMS